MKKYYFVTIIIFILFSIVPEHGKANQIQNIQEALTTLENSKRAILEGSSKDDVDTIVRKHTSTLVNIFNVIKRETTLDIDQLSYNDTIKHLEAKIDINKMRSNAVAVENDTLKLTTNKIHDRIWKFLSFLVEARNSYASREQILFYIDGQFQWLHKIPFPEIPESGSGRAYDALKQTALEYKAASATFSALLKYVKTDVNDFITTSWHSYLRIKTFIAVVNSSCDQVRYFNKMMHPINLTTGKLVVAALIMVLYLSGVLLLKSVDKKMKKVIARYDPALDTGKFFYDKIERPIRQTIIFSILHMILTVFFFDTAIVRYVAIASYTVYSVLLIYLFSNLIDVLVIIRIDRMKRSGRLLREEFINLFIRFLKMIIFISIIITGLDHYGIKITTILSTLGVGGLAIALAAKESLSNFFGGMFILMDDVYRHGEWIQVNNVEGTVVELGVRSTTIRNSANALITVPNAMIAGQQVQNWSRREVGRRIKLTIGVSCDSRMSDMKNTIEDIRAMLKAHPGIAQTADQEQCQTKKMAKLIAHTELQGVKSTQLVYFDSYGEFSLNILVYCFSKTTSWTEWLKVKEDLLYRIKEIIAKNNLALLYPTQVILHQDINSFDSGAV